MHGPTLLYYGSMKVGLLVFAILAAGCTASHEKSAAALPPSVKGTVLVALQPNRLLRIEIKDSKVASQKEYKLIMPKGVQIKAEGFGSMSGPRDGKFVIHLNHEVLAIGQIPSDAQTSIKLTSLGIKDRTGFFATLSPDGRRLAYLKVTENVGNIMPGYKGDLIVRDLDSGKDSVLLKGTYDMPIAWTADSKSLLHLGDASPTEVSQISKDMGVDVGSDPGALIKLDIASKARTIVSVLGSFPVVSETGDRALICISNTQKHDSPLLPKLLTFDPDSKQSAANYKSIDDLSWDPLYLHRPLAIFSDDVVLYAGTTYQVTADGVNLNQNITQKNIEMDHESVSINLFYLKTKTKTKLVTLDKDVVACSFGY